MANIIESRKTKRVLHRFDTAENWKKSTVKLLPGELAFDEYGNFKVGLNERPHGTLWEDLPYAGKAKFVSGPTEELPSVSKNDSYTQGDMFKDTTTNKWYFLTGFDPYGEYVWEELTFGSHDLEASLSNIEALLAQKVDSSVFEEVLSKKANVSDIEAAIAPLATKSELLAVEEVVSDNADKVASLEENVLNALLQIEDKVGGEELESLASTLMSYTNEEVASLTEKLNERATKDELQRAIDAIEFNHDSDLQTHEASVSERLAQKFDKTEAEGLEERLNASIAQKVDVSTLFDESGNIKASLLPGSVDDIVEGVLVEGSTFMPLDGLAQVGVGGKLYLDVNTKTLYRWSGSQYVSISGGGDGGSGSSLILGTVDGTAYEGSAGKRLDDRVTSLEGRTSEIDATVSKHSDALSSLTTTVNENASTVREHAKSILTLEVKTESYDTKIAEVSSSIKEHSTSLNSLDKRVAALENEDDDFSEELAEIKTSVSKVSSIENKVKTLEDRVGDVADDISTLTITTNALSDQVGKLSNAESKVDGLTTSLEALKGVVDQHKISFVEQEGKMSLLETKVDGQKEDFDALAEIVEGHTASLTEQSSKITSIETKNEAQDAEIAELSAKVLEQGNDIAALKEQDLELDELTMKVEEHQTRLDNNLIVLQAHDDRLNALEASDASQKTRLTTIEGTVVQHVGDIAEIKTALEYQDDKLTVVSGKVDNILKIQTPEGTLVLGKLAFQDKVYAEDIEGLSISQLTQNEDEELEFVGGDSSD